MEFLIVRFATQRTVFVDGVASGKTNKCFKVEVGRHRVDLGQPFNYEPQFRRPDVRETTVVSPLEVTFEKL